MAIDHAHKLKQIWQVENGLTHPFLWVSCQWKKVEATLLAGYHWIRCLLKVEVGDRFSLLSQWVTHSWSRYHNAVKRFWPVRISGLKYPDLNPVSIENSQVWQYELRAFKICSDVNHNVIYFFLKHLSGRESQIPESGRSRGPDFSIQTQGTGRSKFSNLNESRSLSVP